tara:strand:- start:75778 stop:76419 length:642 start_codon:yes stop_codon:yes gene_type:complete
MKNKKNLVLGVVLALGAMFIGGAIAYKFYQGESLGIIADKSPERLVRDYSPRTGPTDPKVVLVEFLDPECESCRAFSPFVKDILKKYKDEVQLVVRYATYHRNSAFAVKLLEASREQGKFWEVLDVMFKYQPNWGNHRNPRPELLWYYLPEAGVDVEKVRAQFNNPEYEKRIQQDMKDAEFLQIRGTPSFFINGKPLNEFGKQQLLDAIEREL